MPLTIPDNEAGSLGQPVVQDIPLHGLLVVDDSRHVLSIDAEAEVLLGLSPRGWLGQPLHLLQIPLAEIIAQAFDLGSPVLDREIQLLGSTGEMRTVLVAVRLVKAGAGPLAMVNLLDVTSLREREATTHRLERLASIGTLSASMAHEIKNALVAVRTFAELLANKHQDAELAELAMREIKRIDSIVSQMLRFGGLGRPTFNVLRLNEVLAHSCRLIQHQLNERRVELVQEFNADPDAIRGDSYQLHQVLLNLLFNALDAMPGGGRISVRSEYVPLPPSARSDSVELHSCIRVTVMDTGSGIAPEHLAKMFEPFFTTKPQGTGLGLSITRRIIKEHGATVAVDSEPGRGTRFTLLFPAASA